MCAEERCVIPCCHTLQCVLKEDVLRCAIYAEGRCRPQCCHAVQFVEEYYRVALYCHDVQFVLKQEREREALSYHTIAVQCI